MNRYACSRCGSTAPNQSCYVCAEDRDYESRLAMRRESREAVEWTDRRTTPEIKRDLSLMGVRVLCEDDPNQNRSHAGTVSVLVVILAVVALVVALTR